MSRAYELMIIIDGDVDDPKAQAWMKTVSDGVSTAGGELHGKIDWWGKRQFAYPINKKPAGYYMVAEIVAPPGSLDELERALRLADDVVRHKLIRLPEPEAERRGMAITAA
jgi:small subunit ribosomal protein S6